MRTIFILTIISVFIATVLAIKCYECDSITTPQCNEYFYSEGVEQIDCDDAEMPEYLEKYHGRRFQPTGCLTKIHEGIKGADLFIRRTCYFGDKDNTDEACQADDPYVPYLDILDCRVCYDDLCNTDDAGIQKPSIYIIFTLCLGVVLRKVLI